MGKDGKAIIFWLVKINRGMKNMSECEKKDTREEKELSMRGIRVK